jgi:serine/threonine protein kinase
MGCITGSDKAPSLVILQAKDYGCTQRALLRTKGKDDLWYAETKMPLTDEQTKDPWSWDKPPRKYDLDLQFSRFKPSRMTLAPDTDGKYVKKLDLLRHGLEAFAIPWSRNVTLREIETCEHLMRYSHPNVCLYRGVTVDKGRVSGLVFDRFDMNINQAVHRGHYIDTAKCLRHIERGIRHFHKLGLVHADVKPDNIFVNLATQEFVLGDFDAVHKEGALLTLRCGTLGWTPAYEETDELATKDIDWYSLEMLRAWLKVKCHTNDGLYVPVIDILREARLHLGGAADSASQHSSRSGGSEMHTSE